MIPCQLEILAMRASLTLAARAVRTVAFSNKTLNDDARLLNDVLNRIQDLEAAILQLDLAQENDSLF